MDIKLEFLQFFDDEVAQKEGSPVLLEVEPEVEEEDGEFEGLTE